MLYVLVSSRNSSSKKNNRPKVGFFPFLTAWLIGRFFTLLSHNGYLTSRSFLTTVSFWSFLPKGSCSHSHLQGWKCPTLERLQTSCWLCDSSTPAVTRQLSPHLFPSLYAALCLTLQGFTGNLWQEKSGRVWPFWPIFILWCDSVCALRKPKSCCRHLLLQLIVMTCRVLLRLLHQKKNKQLKVFLQFPFLAASALLQAWCQNPEGRICYHLLFFAGVFHLPFWAHRWVVRCEKSSELWPVWFLPI